MDKTVEAILAQLTENTGRHFLDSGGAYGRNWERNQRREFDKEPAVSVQWSCWNGQLELEATVSLYHWMVHNLELDERLQKMMNAYTELNPEANWFEVAEGFADLLAETTGFGKGRVINTYNDPDNCDLSQTIQYIEMSAEGGNDFYDVTHLILQVHGGCDVRGGYSSPRIYKCSEEYHALFDTMRVDSMWTDGREKDKLQLALDAFEPTPEDIDEFSWYWQGYNSFEQNKRTLHEIDLDPFKLPVVDVDEGGELIEAQDFYWIAISDKRAFLMAPGRITLDNELHAGNNL